MKDGQKKISEKLFRFYFILFLEARELIISSAIIQILCL